MSEVGPTELTNGHQRLIAVDEGRPNAARVHDHLLGGKDNFGVDRREAQRILAIAPKTGLTCVAGRQFMQRAVRHLVHEGITQFLDLGTGLPDRPDVHEVAEEVTEDARVIYVDNDPVVAVHGHALLATRISKMIEADLRDPAHVLESQNLLDLSRPVGLIVNSVLHRISDEDDPAGIIAGYMERLAPGSHLILSHFTDEIRDDPGAVTPGAELDPEILGFWRGHDEILEMFSGLEPLEPGLVRTSHWRPEWPTRIILSGAYGAVARKP